jgi:hypothetical protein
VGARPPLRGVLQRIEPDTPRSIPSTLPPPPFASETHVEGLEWWLDSHVEFASGLLCLRQLLESVPEGTDAGRSVRSMSAVLETIRDALYELYCDAADERLDALLGPGREMDQVVRASYAWCAETLEAMNASAGVLREGTKVDREAISRVFRHVAARPLPSIQPLLAAIRTLQIDFSSPVEPLRLLERDIEVLHSSTAELSSYIDGWVIQSFTAH